MNAGAIGTEHDSLLACCMWSLLLAAGSDCVHVCVCVSVLRIHPAVAFLVLVPRVVQVALYCRRGPYGVTHVTDEVFVHSGWL